MDMFWYRVERWHCQHRRARRAPGGRIRELPPERACAEGRSQPLRRTVTVHSSLSTEHCSFRQVLECAGWTALWIPWIGMRVYE